MQWFVNQLLCHNAAQDNDLTEFDESREIVQSLVDEYKACESPDYIKWGMEVPLNILTCTIAYFDYLKYYYELRFASFTQDRSRTVTADGNASGSLDPLLPA